MNGSPLVVEPVFHIGPLPITEPVLATWALMAALGLGAVVVGRRLELRPGRLQSALELIVEALDAQIRDIVRGDPAPYRNLIGALFLFILAANWSSLIPGVEPPTARIETDAALALIVAGAAIGYGVRSRGLLGYLATFAQPSWVMIPFNILDQITRTFALTMRLFGNVMSSVFAIGVVLSLAGLFVPIPLMALEILTGAIQAYIFAVLAAVFVGAAVAEPAPPAGWRAPDRKGPS